MKNEKELCTPSELITETNDDNYRNEVIIDKYYFVHTFFFLMGLMHQLPWKFFVTANDYWMYKFRNTSLDQTDSDSRTSLQVQFSTSMQISLYTSNVTFLLLTTIFGYKFRLNLRIIGAVLVILLLFILSAVFIKIDTDSWQMEFFIMTMLLIAAINAFNAVFAISIYAVLSKFPHVYLKLYLLGQGIAEIFTAILQILSLAIGFSTEISAIIYFGLGIIVITLGLVMILSVQYVNYYKHQMKQYHEGEREKIITFQEARIIIKKIFIVLLTEISIILTMSPLHTSITALIVSEGEGNGVWNDVYFVPTITFLFQAICSFVGRIVATNLKKNLTGKLLMLNGFVRLIVFYPLIMLCNARPRSHLPVIFPHDYQYILIISIFGFTSGYISVMCFLNIAKLVSEKELKNAYSILMNFNALLMGTSSYLGLLTIRVI